MFGDGRGGADHRFNPDYPGFLLAILPPGAFFGLALLIVAKNWVDLRPRQNRGHPARPGTGMNQQKRQEIFERLREHIDKPRSDLEFTNRISNC